MDDKKPTILFWTGYNSDENTKIMDMLEKLNNDFNVSYVGQSDDHRPTLEHKGNFYESFTAISNFCESKTKKISV